MFKNRESSHDIFGEVFKEYKKTYNNIINTLGQPTDLSDPEKIVESANGKVIGRISLSPVSLSSELVVAVEPGHSIFFGHVHSIYPKKKASIEFGRWFERPFFTATELNTLEPESASVEIGIMHKSLISNAVRLDPQHAENSRTHDIVTPKDAKNIALSVIKEINESCL